MQATQRSLLWQQACLSKKTRNPSRCPFYRLIRPSSPFLVNGSISRQFSRYAYSPNEGIKNIEHVDTIVIGAGVIGLACAARLSSSTKTTLILDAESSFGTHTSSRNSEVIHAGIYYRPGSLQAEMCVEGRQRLYHWCRANNVPFHKIGKLLVAVEENEEQALENLYANALENNCFEMEHLEKRQVARMEPNVRAHSALLSTETGIIDSHAFMSSLLTHASEVSHGQTSLIPRTTVIGAYFDTTISAWIIDGFSNGETFRMSAGAIINAAGLGAQALAAATQNYPVECIPPLSLCKGRYMDYAGASPFERLIYPLPDKASNSLGTHATIDMGGKVRFGPDASFLPTTQTQSLGRETWKEIREKQLELKENEIRKTMFSSTIDSTEVDDGYGMDNTNTNTSIDKMEEVVEVKMICKAGQHEKLNENSSGFYGEARFQCVKTQTHIPFPILTGLIFPNQFTTTSKTSLSQPGGQEEGVGVVEDSCKSSKSSLPPNSSKIVSPVNDNIDKDGFGKLASGIYTENGRSLNSGLFVSAKDADFSISEFDSPIDVNDHPLPSVNHHLTAKKIEQSQQYFTPSGLGSSDLTPPVFRPPLRREILYSYETNWKHPELASGELQKDTSLAQRSEDQLRLSFAKAISRYFPLVDPEKLRPGLVGVRPKLSRLGQPAADFSIQGPSQHGLPQLVSLFGIESPGLTSSLAIAERVAALLKN